MAGALGADGNAMQVAVLMDRYLPIIGGAQKNVHLLCRSFIDRGWEVTVLTRRVFPDLAEEERIDGVTVRRMGWLPGGNSPMGQFLSKWWAGCCAARWIYRRRDQVDVVLTVPIGPYSDLLAAYVGWRWTGIPYVVRGSSLGNNFERMLGSVHGVERLTRILAPRALWRAALTRATTVTVQSSVIREKARRFGIEPQVIANGVDTERYRPRSDEQRAELRRRLGLPQDRVIAICVGRYVREKNQGTLIRAVERLERGKASGRLQVLIVGASEPGQVTSNERELKRYVTRRGMERLVRFEDNVDNVDAFLGASDIFVFPSKFPEGMPNAVLEAMASGLPVLASNLSQVRCMFPDGYNSFFDPDDVATLSEHLAALIEDPERRRRQGSELAAWAREHYSLRDQQSTYGALLRSVTCEPGALSSSDQASLSNRVS